MQCGGTGRTLRRWSGGSGRNRTGSGGRTSFAAPVAPASGTRSTACAGRWKGPTWTSTCHRLGSRPSRRACLYAGPCSRLASASTSPARGLLSLLVSPSRTCTEGAPLTMRALAALAVLTLTGAPTAAQQSNPGRDSLIARAKSLELSTPYVPPPGTSLEHDAAGFVQIMCSAVFITGLDPDFAAENVGYFTAPYAERAKLGTPKIDREKRRVQVTMPNGKVRTAK